MLIALFTPIYSSFSFIKSLAVIVIVDLQLLHLHMFSPVTLLCLVFFFTTVTAQNCDILPYALYICCFFVVVALFTQTQIMQ